MAHDRPTQARNGDWNAIVLAGGRASRLDGHDKTALLYQNRTLLEYALAAVEGAGAIAVIGPPELQSRLGRGRSSSRTALATEVPRFGGPACSVARGLETLSSAPSIWTAVVAADQPHAIDAITALLAERRWHAQSDAILAQDDRGRRQPLLALYRTRPLTRAIATSGNTDGLSMMALCSRLAVVSIPLGDFCHDVDTPEDAAHFGIELPVRQAARA